MMMTDGRKKSDVVILCGGKGTRLKEETESKPKPMVEIGGQPILWHIMKYYSHYGFSRFVLALGYKSDAIQKFFSNSSSVESDWEVVCVDTGLNTLKGARIKRLESYIQSDFFHLTYGDGLSDVNLRNLQAFHLEQKKIGTVTAVHPPSRFGEMDIEGNFVVRFEEKAQLKTGYINGGFFVFDKSFLNCLTEDSQCDLEFGALQKLSRDRELVTYKHQGYWQCMDNVRDMEYLNKLWNSGSPPWKVWS